MHSSQKEIVELSRQMRSRLELTLRGDQIEGINFYREFSVTP